jgi:hypothetical protein
VLDQTPFSVESTARLPTPVESSRQYRRSTGTSPTHWKISSSNRGSLSVHGACLRRGCLRNGALDCWNAALFAKREQIVPESLAGSGSGSGLVKILHRVCQPIDSLVYSIARSEARRLYICYVKNWSRFNISSRYKKRKKH